MDSDQNQPVNKNSFSNNALSKIDVKELKQAAPQSSKHLGQASPLQFQEKPQTTKHQNNFQQNDNDQNKDHENSFDQFHQRKVDNQQNQQHGQNNQHQQDDPDSLFNTDRSSHPSIIVAQVFFKVLSISIFYIGAIFLSSINVYILLILCQAFDFYIVKNISGRMLVGLRWWIEFNEQGKEKWVFECRANTQEQNPYDKMMFWGSQFTSTAFWVLIAFFEVLSFSFSDGVPCVVCIICQGTNLLYYYRCHKQQKIHIDDLINGAKQHGQEYIGNKMVQCVIKSKIS